MSNFRFTYMAVFCLSLLVTGTLVAPRCEAQTNRAPKPTSIPDSAELENSRTADEDINIKLKELMSHPNSNMRTFDALDEGSGSTRIKPPENGANPTSTVPRSSHQAD